jgi:hypothetical protein
MGYGKREELEEKNILPYIKKYIMKKKYLAFLDYSYPLVCTKDDDLAS